MSQIFIVERHFNDTGHAVLRLRNMRGKGQICSWFKVTFRRVKNHSENHFFHGKNWVYAKENILNWD
jgi:hypothetical protein